MQAAERAGAGQGVRESPQKAADRPDMRRLPVICAASECGNAEATGTYCFQFRTA